MLGKHHRLRSVVVAIFLLAVAATPAIGLLAWPAAAVQAVDICKAPYDPGPLNPDQFKDSNGKPNEIDNPYFPLEPGTTFVYQGTTKAGETERVAVTVSTQKKTIQGVPTTVVRDEVTVDGERVELTFDWFAQHDNGAVWYFGEDAKDYEDGEVVSTAGSWEAGKNGAKRGIIMKAQPRVGDTYRQEFAPGVAEDAAEVRHLDRTASVPYGSFDDLLQTRDFSCLETGSENKYYAPGVGLVLEVGRGNERLELIAVQEAND